MTSRSAASAIPLTTDEQRLLWLHELDPESADYNLRLLLRVRCHWDRVALETAFAEVLRRHPVLASKFERTEEGDPSRTVLTDFAVPIQDLGAPDDSVAALVELSLDPFDLFQAPPIRAAHAASDDGVVIGLFMHHAVADGRSLAIVEHELRELYLGSLEERSVDLGPVPKDSTDLAESEAGASDPVALEAHLAHWRETLGGWEPVELPSDRPALARRASGERAHSFELPEQQSETLQALASEHRCPLTGAVHAVFVAWLVRHTGQSDVTVGLALDNRRGRDYQDAVGFFVRTLPLRVCVDRETTFLDLMRQSSVAIRSGRKQWAPYDRILAAVGAGGGARFADALVVHHGARSEGTDPRIERVPLVQPGTRFGVELNTIVVDGRLAGDLRFRHGLLSAPGEEAAAQRWVKLLQACLEQPTVPIIDLALDEHVPARATVPVETDPPLLVETLAATVAARGQDRALVCGADSWSFAELGILVTDLAQRLGAAGVGPRTRVAVLLPRSAGQVLGVLGVIAAAGVAVPLDVDDPPERWRRVLSSADVDLVVTSPDGPEVECLPTVLVEPVPVAPAAPGPGTLVTLSRRIDRVDVAYVIHTSGSTGTPKGVVVEHDQLAHLAARLRADVTSTTHGRRRVAMTAALTFDVSWQGLLALAEGHELHVVSEPVRRDAEEFCAYLRACEIELLDVTPSHLAALLECGLLDDGTALRQVVVAGEAIPAPLWHRLAESDVDVHNFYGPTETTVYITRCRIDQTTGPRIGKPFDGSAAYVLDAMLRPVPRGIRGELYLHGPQVARGYLGQPGLTAERFVADPFAGDGARMYRTGDLARWDDESMLVFDGRRDGQVKLRGFRIELAEIEAVLTSHPTVTQAVVRVRGEQEQARLVAYVTTQVDLSTGELRDYCSTCLPRHMVPSAVVVLEAFPLTSSGKLDANSLPAPLYADPGNHRRVSASPREAVVCRIFAETLDLDDYGPNDDFFDSGGHSLLLTQVLARVRSALGVEVRVRDVMDAPTPAGLVRALDEESARPALVQREHPPRFPLSADQQRLWFIAQAEDRASTYTIPIAMRLLGTLDVEALRAAVQDVVQRHQALRTVFGETDGVPWQQVLDPDGDQPLPAVGDVLDVDPARTDVAVLLDALIHEPIDLTRDPPLRVHLVRAGPEDYVLLLLVHHVAGDGWSTRLLRRDLALAYDARADGRPPRLSAQQATYADYVAWSTESLASSDATGVTTAEHQADYWSQELAGLPVELDLLTDHARPAVASGRAHVVDLTAPGDLHTALERVARSCGVTTTMIFHAAVAALLHRLGAGDDVPLGAVVSTRSDPRLEDEVGFFVNTQVLRLDVGGRPTFTELVRRVRSTALSAYDHHDLPFDRVVELINPPRSLARHPLFTVMVVVQTDEQEDQPFGPLTSRVEPTRLAAAKFDLSMTLFERRDTEAGGGLRLRLEASADLFEKATAQRVGQLLLRLLTSAVEDPDAPVELLALLENDQRERVIALGDGGPDALDAGPGVPALFAAQVARTPEAVVLDGDSGPLTYRELDRWSDAVAGALCEHGVLPGQRVALLVGRSPGLVAAELGVLKSGAAYVPLQTSDPDDRLCAALRQSGAVLVLHDEGQEARAGRLTGRSGTLDHQALPGPADRVGGGVGVDTDAVRGDDLAYVMFTSGSTGEPKGVAVTHANIAALAADHRWRGGAHDRVLLHSATAFDASTYEIWVPLLRGGTVVVGPDDVTDPQVLAEQVRRYRLTAVWLTSGLFQLVAELAPQALRGLVEVWAGGDVVPPETVRRVLDVCPGLVVCNGYGPTETTTFAASHRVESFRDLAAPLPIGRPLDGTRLRVLDATLAPAPPGVPGDLYIAGTGLARGYLERPGLTAERFVADPYGPPGARMYWTGDRATWDDEGRLVFLGRGDRQIKLRGFRIEPDEVAAVIGRQPGVGQAEVVVVGEGHARRLAAYVTPVTVDTETLAQAVAQVLPPYAVPSTIQTLDAVPLTRNGKVDRVALAALSASRREPDIELSGNVCTMCDLFTEVLGTDEVASGDDFFARGGNSLLVVRLISRVRARLGVDLTVQQVFDHPTPAGLAAVTEEGGAVLARPPLLPAAADESDQLAPNQRGLWFLQQLDGGRSAYNVPVATGVRGAVDVEALRAALGDVLGRHEPLRTLVVETDGDPRPVVCDDDAVIAGVLSTVEEPTDLMAVVDTEANRPFDLAREIPIRALMVVTAPGEHVLVLTVHHLAIDGWSLGTLWRELAEAYEARCAGTAPTWAPLPVRYADYAAWQGKLLGPSSAPTPFAQAQLAFWARALRDLPDQVTLPYTGTRPESGVLTARCVDVTWDEDTVVALRELAASQGATLQMVIQAAVAAVLARAGAGDDIVIGTPAAGRTDTALDDLVGYFVTMVVLRIRPDDGSRFVTLLRHVRDTSLAAFAHQDVPFEQVVQHLAPQRRPGRNPLFQTLVTCVRRWSDGRRIGDAELSAQEAELRSAKFDLSFEFVESDASLTCRIVYAGELFADDTAQAMARALRSFIADDAVHPATMVEVVQGRPQHDEPVVIGSSSAASATSPRSHLLRDLFAEVLGRDDLDLGSDFFAVGGHSLAAVRVAVRARDVLGVEIALSHLLAGRTPAGVAALLDGDDQALPYGELLTLRPSRGGPEIFAVHPVTGPAWSYIGLTRHLPPDVGLHGLQATGLDPTAPLELARSVEEAARSAISRIRDIQPMGPYHLMGWSYGGNLAHAIATALQADGAQVASLVLLDSYPLHLVAGAATTPDVAAAVRGHLSGPAAAGLRPAERTRIEAITENNLAIGGAFRPATFDGDVLLVRADASHRPAGIVPELWAPYVEGSIDVVPVEHGHFALLDLEAQPAIARIVMTHVEQSS